MARRRTVVRGNKAIATYRVERGGSWNDLAVSSSVLPSRFSSAPPGLRGSYYRGFRHYPDAHSLESLHLYLGGSRGRRPLVEKCGLVTPDGNLRRRTCHFGCHQLLKPRLFVFVLWRHLSRMAY